MDFMLPYPPMKPSPPIKARFKSRSNKLSLKDKLQMTDSFKGNKEEVSSTRNTHQQKNALLYYQKDLCASLISSDESDHEDNLLSDSTCFHGSQICLPKAESTRLESGIHPSDDMTNRASFFSCRSLLSPTSICSSNNLSSSDSHEQEGTCEESIIYVSDNESSILPKSKGNQDIVISESSESDSTNKNSKQHQQNAKQHQQNAKDNIETIILDSSSEVDSSVIKKHFVGKTVLSNLNQLSKNGVDQHRNFIIPTSSSSDSSEDIIDSSVQKTNKNHCISASIELFNKKKLPQHHDQKVILETSEEESGEEESQEISLRTLAAEKLSETKVHDIQRWIDRNNATSFESTDIETQFEKLSTAVSKSPPRQEDDGSSTDDSFDALIRRYRNPVRKTRKPFFAVDSSSGSSTSPLKKHDIPKPARKPLPKPSTKEGVEYVPKPGKKPVYDTPRRGKKAVDDTPRPRKETVDKPKPGKKTDKTPRPRKRPVDSTPRPENKAVEDVNTPSETRQIVSKQGKVEELKKTGTPYSPIRTFLTSLSGPPKDPSLRNHPEASIYYKNYKSKKEELAKRLFKLYNREVFDGRLPDDLVIEWNARMVSTAGYCSCKLIRKPEGTSRTARIVLATKILDSADRLRDTLIHELCHAAVWLLNNISGGHGPFWKAWANKAERRFPELPPIKRCHEYKIETKFTYRCTDCGYSFGRHSKSINLQTQRCGHCYGTFEVLVNKQGKNNGSAVATPATPKPPTGFALFVKENYGSVKKEHSEKKHGDIMKLLGQKFAEVKIGQGTR